MADEKRRLGRGLESLIDAARGQKLDMEVIQSTGHRIQAIPLGSLEPNPYQPRREFGIEALNELVESLRLHGLMQPIVVRRAAPRMQIIAGERRWRAAQELGWDTIETVVVDADDRRMVEWALVENLQREALGPLELAHAFRRMTVEFRLTQEEIGRAVGMSRPAVANLIRLLDLPASVQDRVSRGTLTAGSARALLGLPGSGDQESIAEQAEKGGLNVRQVEELVRRRASPRPGSAHRRTEDPNLQALTEELQDSLGTRVRLQGSLDRGRLVIHYHSGRDLDRIIRRVRGVAPGFDGPADDEEEEAGGIITV